MPSKLNLCDPALQKLDRNEYIRSFILSQKPYQSDHANEGRKVAALWDTTVDDQSCENLLQRGSSNKTAPGISGCGFSSPVLRPRVAHVSVSDPRTATRSLEMVDDEQLSLKPHNVSKSLESSNPPKDVLTESIDKKHNAPATSTSKPKAHMKRKLKASAESEEEYEARLSERRDRKRKKRAIINPGDGEEPTDKENNDTEIDAIRRTAGKPIKTSHKNTARKQKTPAGLALMHGFVAKNVTKERLTLVKAQTVGVFNKGKASAKTSVKNQAGKHDKQSRVFSEAKFLNQVSTPFKSKTWGTQSEPSSEATAQSLSSVAHNATAVVDIAKPLNKKFLITNYDTSKRKKHVDHTPTSPDRRTLPDASRSAKFTPDSEKWDIESDSTEAGSAHITEDTPESVVIQTSHWKSFKSPKSDQHVQASAQEDAAMATNAHVLQAKSHHNDLDGDRSSIAPSHSASQNPCLSDDQPKLPVANESAYFQKQNIKSLPICTNAIVASEDNTIQPLKHHETICEKTPNNIQVEDRHFQSEELQEQVLLNFPVDHNRDGVRSSRRELTGAREEHASYQVPARATETQLVSDDFDASAVSLDDAVRALEGNINTCSKHLDGSWYDYQATTPHGYSCAVNPFSHQSGDLGELSSGSLDGFEFDSDSQGCTDPYFFPGQENCGTEVIATHAYPAYRESPPYSSYDRPEEGTEIMSILDTAQADCELTLLSPLELQDSMLHTSFICDEDVQNVYMPRDDDSGDAFHCLTLDSNPSACFHDHLGIDLVPNDCEMPIETPSFHSSPHASVSSERLLPVEPHDLLLRFAQGRALLFGFDGEQSSTAYEARQDVEADVARKMQGLGHWFPQKY
ncbi:hypothetical protein BD410DRAFT_18184 [Rickenella mellea]|uniref:Uncharacterized protein n=1 Tax=Rickenella mellea TaxID=50990 RepID=A0A4R5XF20_9AGAM|nr:hypothetical protein BD410DRAFT_18184 [Rickenella mellea]